MNWQVIEVMLIAISMLSNLVLVVGGAFGTLILKGLNQSLAEMKQRSGLLEASLREIELLVKGKHVTREEVDRRLDTMNTAIFNKLDKIENKLDMKADRDEREREHVLK